MVESGKGTTRTRILAAAAEVAKEGGPGSLSLEAVALKAGVSKGGLLYHFPSKAKLLQALVDEYLRDFEREIERARDAGGGETIRAYVDLSARECEKQLASKAWIFSAIAEDPDFVEPIRLSKRRLYEALMAEGGDGDAALLVFLAIEGLRSMKLFDFDVLSPADERRAFGLLRSIAAKSRT